MAQPIQASSSNPTSSSDPAAKDKQPEEKSFFSTSAKSLAQAMQAHRECLQRLHCQKPKTSTSSATPDLVEAPTPELQKALDELIGNQNNFLLSSARRAHEFLINLRMGDWLEEELKTLPDGPIKSLWQEQYDKLINTRQQLYSREQAMNQVQLMAQLRLADWVRDEVGVTQRNKLKPLPPDEFSFKSNLESL